jgi:phosphopantetheinyl transferase
VSTITEETPLPEVSLSHSDNAAVAVASSVPLGVDLERADRDVTEILPNFATEDEQAAINALSASDYDDTWPLRLWCAKEAASKALGTGLQGRPKRFQLVEAASDGHLVILDTESSRSFTVGTWLYSEWMIALAREETAEASIEEIDSDPSASDAPPLSLQE